VAATHCGVLELRQYTLRPGRPEELIELFDTHLVEPQEEVGMHILGHFRDVDRPDRFAPSASSVARHSRIIGVARSPRGTSPSEGVMCFLRVHQ
jgi:hypothetical protein